MRDHLERKHRCCTVLVPTQMLEQPETKPDWSKKAHPHPNIRRKLHVHSKLRFAQSSSDITVGRARGGDTIHSPATLAHEHSIYCTVLYLFHAQEKTFARASIARGSLNALR